jgi:hypothetical protein
MMSIVELTDLERRYQAVIEIISGGLAVVEVAGRHEARA